MSNSFHNKWHRTNHQTYKNPDILDSGWDPIASYDVPFSGDFVMSSGYYPPTGDVPGDRYKIYSHDIETVNLLGWGPNGASSSGSDIHVWANLYVHGSTNVTSADVNLGDHVKLSSGTPSTGDKMVWYTPTQIRLWNGVDETASPDNVLTFPSRTGTLALDGDFMDYVGAGSAFPSSPTSGEVFKKNGTLYLWDGTEWVSFGSGASPANGTFVYKGVIQGSPPSASVSVGDVYWCNNYNNENGFYVWTGSWTPFCKLTSAEFFAMLNSTGIYRQISAAQTSADSAYRLAELASDAATTAQDTANSAKDAAGTAKDAADAAKSAADTARSAAYTAQNNAEYANIIANGAFNKADDASSLADLALGAAQSASAAADSAGAAAGEALRTAIDAIERTSGYEFVLYSKPIENDDYSSRYLTVGNSEYPASIKDLKLAMFQGSYETIALSRAIAPEIASGSAYDAGSYCMFDGRLWKALESMPSGVNPWTQGSKWTEVNLIGERFSSSALENKFTKLVCHPYGTATIDYDDNGFTISDTLTLHSRLDPSGTYTVSAGTKFVYSHIADANPDPTIDNPLRFYLEERALTATSGYDGFAFCCDIEMSTSTPFMTWVSLTGDGTSLGGARLLWDIGTTDSSFYNADVFAVSPWTDASSLWTDQDFNEKIWSLGFIRVQPVTKTIATLDDLNDEYIVSPSGGAKIVVTDSGAAQVVLNGTTPNFQNLSELAEKVGVDTNSIDSLKEQFGLTSENTLSDLASAVGDRSTLAYENAIADSFSVNVGYEVGDLVTRRGLLYRCVSAHSSSEWVGKHFAEISMADSIKSRSNRLSYTTVDAETITLIETKSVYKITATGGVLPAITSTNIPTSDDYFCFEIEATIPSGATLDSTAWASVTWLPGFELPTYGYAGKTLYIGCRLDCRTRAVSASCWRVA